MKAMFLHDCTHREYINTEKERAEARAAAVLPAGAHLLSEFCPFLHHPPLLVGISVKKVFKIQHVLRV